MAEKSVFDQIKKQNGESFAKAIRAYDNGIFDGPGIVDIVRYAGRDAEPIMQYLVSLKDIKIEENETGKDPIELLSEAGYDAYYVTTLAEQNRISEYFEPNEMLCTFRDPTRFQRYHIINAVKKMFQRLRGKILGVKSKEKTNMEQVLYLYRFLLVVVLFPSKTGIIIPYPIQIIHLVAIQIGL